MSLWAYYTRVGEQSVSREPSHVARAGRRSRANTFSARGAKGWPLHEEAKKLEALMQDDRL
eukprot:6384271-Prymnesium_polylepis.1